MMMKELNLLLMFSGAFSSVRSTRRRKFRSVDNRRKRRRKKNERRYQVDVVDALVDGRESVDRFRTCDDDHVAPALELGEAALNPPDVVGRDPVVATSLDVQGHQVHAPVQTRGLGFKVLFN